MNTQQRMAVKNSAIAYASQYAGLDVDALCRMAEHCKLDGAGLWSETLAAQYEKMAAQKRTSPDSRPESTDDDGAAWWKVIFNHVDGRKGMVQLVQGTKADAANAFACNPDGRYLVAIEKMPPGF